jgi:muramoyltetrapeptide carboxypeptidase
VAARRRTRGDRPHFLNKGDKVGVMAPGFAVKSQPLRAGLDELVRLGYEPCVGDHVLSQDGYLAGNDEQRAADLVRFMRSPDLRALWFARGGFGTARLLPEVPWATLRRDPKLMIGYSDLTALFNAVIDRTPAICLYGPVVTELGDPQAWHRPSLRALLAGRPYTLRFPRRAALIEGRAEGRLIGGNLSVLTHLLGTPYEPDFRDAILFLEEVGEQTYRVDRMLTQLRQSGALRKIAGVLLGAITAPTRRRFPSDRSLHEVLGEAFAPLGVPVIRGIEAGHMAHKRTLPLGARTVIDTASGTIRFTP